MSAFREVGITGLGSYGPAQIGPEQATSDLAVEAARLALEQARVAPAEVDLILVATINPDMLMPATACLVQEKLGGTAPAFDLGAACPGFLYALVAGAKFVAAGNYRTVLVVGADVMSRLGGRFPSVPECHYRDGAGAVVLQPAPSGSGLLASDLGSEGRHGEALMVPAGGSRLPASMATVERHDHTLRLDAGRFLPWAQRAFQGTVRTTLKRSQLRSEEIDLLLLHHAGPPDLRLDEEALGFPRQRVLRTAETCGNAGAASLPMALDQAHKSGRLLPGHRVLLAGLGGGLTWASAVVRW